MMRVEIGEPLQREATESKEDLPPVEGFGFTDRSFDPLAEWKARQAAKGGDEVVYREPMPGIELMPNWRGFVGWIEPKAQAQAQPAVQAKPQAEPEAVPPKPKVPAVQPAPDAGEEETLNVALRADETVALQAPEPRGEPIKIADPTPDAFEEETLNLGNLDLSAVIEAAAAAVGHSDKEQSEVSSPEPSSPFAPPEPAEKSPEATLIFSLGEPAASLELEPEESEPAAPIKAAQPSPQPRSTGIALEPDPVEGASVAAPAPVQTEPTLVVSIDEPVAAIAPPTTEPQAVAPSKPGLVAKLAGVRPLAHPGRLPRGFTLSNDEKVVLRLCDGRRTTQAIFDGDCALDADELTNFLKRCAKVKLVTFKR